MKRNTGFFRNIMPALCAIFLAASLASCDKHTLTARSAKKAIEKETAFRDSSQVVQIGIGYYEVDSAAKQKLEALAKEGVISCKISGTTERHRFEKYTWWEGTKVFYKDITHYFAEVSLTEEGKKFVVSNPPVKPLGEDNIPEADYHNMSADSLQTEAFSDNSTNGSADAVSEKSASTIQKDTTGNANPYSEALKKVKLTTVNVLTGFYKVEKVLNVFCPDNYRKSGIGKCNFVCIFTGITPFGKILTTHKDGERTYGNADFTRFEDKGWRVEIYDINGGTSAMPQPAF